MFVTACLLLLHIHISQSDNTYEVDLSDQTSPIWAFWETSTTFDHGYQALRQDWREQLLQTHLDLGTQFVRFHETFDNDIGMVNPADPSLPYSYVNIDKIYDYILSIGMKPLVELDMMPSAFTDPSHVSKMYNRPVYVGPPSDMNIWHDFITQFFQHLTNRYGPQEISTWAFEAWNEPNCADNWWQSNITTFLETWNVTAHAIKNVNKNYNIGGPASCGVGWIPEFPQWCKDNEVPIDFVSAHPYPSAAQGHDGFMKQLQGLSDTVNKVDSSLGIYITAYGCYTEPGNFDMGPHDTSENAACFTTFASQFQNLDSKQYGLMSFTGFSDLWDQRGVASQPFHNGYGWTTVRGLKKPTYRALELLHKYATGRYYFKGVNGNNQDVTNNTLELLATIDDNSNNDSSNQICLFISNFAMTGNPITGQTVEINLTNIRKNQYIPTMGTLYRIDPENTNPAEIWSKDMNSPTYPTHEQLDALEDASQLTPQTINVNSATEDSISFKLNIPVNSLAVIIVEL